MNNFDLKKFLVENKLTANSKSVKEGAALPNKPGDPIYVVDEKEVNEDKRIVPADLVREYDMEKTGESIQYEFRTEEGSRVKIGADNLPGYINSLLDKAGNKGVTLTFISKIGLVPDYKITNRTDDMGRPLNQ